MKTITTTEIKAEICKTQNCGMDEIMCRHCKNWAYNKGGVMTSTFASKCSRNKQRTVGYQYCRGFEKI